MALLVDLVKVGQELKLGVVVLVALDFELGLLVPLLLQLLPLLLLLRQEVLRAAVADELAPAAVVLLVRHPSGHTQPSGFLKPPDRRNDLQQ